MQPRLWIGPAGLDALRAKARSGTPALIAETARRTSLLSDDDLVAEMSSPTQAFGLRAAAQRRAQCAAIAHLLDGDPRHARSGLNAIRILFEQDHSDLGRASDALHAVLVWDWCRSAWTPEERDEIGRWLVKTALSFEVANKGNPDNPFNNWWGVTHSAAGLCAMAVQGEYSGAEVILTRARERVRSYLTNYGDRGHYYEGTGYGAYSMSQWGPFITAARHADGIDLLEYCPGLHWLPSTVHAMTVIRPARSDSEPPASPPGTGMRISWNDDGGQASHNGDIPIMFALAPREQLPALRWFYDRIQGELGDRTFAAGWCGLAWSLLYYPSDIPAAVPEGLLPKTVVDNRNGLIIFRNRYRDADDTVFGAYAKAYKGGGHQHEDAGSWRLMSHGHLWAMAGGQAKTGPESQCALIKNPGNAHELPTKGKHKTGQVSYITRSDDGETASVDLRITGCYEARLVDRKFALDFSGRSGADVLLACLDTVWDHQDADWAWTLSFDQALRPELGDSWFKLHAHDGTSLLARWISPQGVSLSLNPGQPTERTFANGHTIHYPAVPAIMARHRGTKFDYFCIMTITRGTHPECHIEGQGGDAVVRVGPRVVRLQKGTWYHGPVRITDA
jgi:hypothetical protein